jgi:hypothetical protein
LEDIEMANGTSVAGTWAYRGYINTSDQPVFGAGLFTFQTPTATTLTGTLGMGSNLVLDLEGTITPANGALFVDQARRREVQWRGRNAGGQPVDFHVLAAPR